MESPYQVGLTLAEWWSVKGTWRTSLKLVRIITTSFGPCTKYIGRVIGSLRKLGTPIGQQLACGENSGLPESRIALRWRILSAAQGLRMGLSGSPNAKVACFPVRRNSSLETCRWPGSAATGPGPLGGGMNSRE